MSARKLILEILPVVPSRFYERKVTMLRALLLLFFCVSSSALDYYCGERGLLKKFNQFPEEMVAGGSIVCTMKIKRGGSYKPKEATFRCENDVRTGAKDGDTVLGLEWSTAGAFGGPKKPRAVLLAPVPAQDNGEGAILLSYKGEVLETRGASVDDLLSAAKPSTEAMARNFAIGPTSQVTDDDLITFINDMSRACLPKKKHLRMHKVKGG